MLNNLRIKNFRMLEDLEIPKLGRVNLIIGRNNSGKSTVLEALRVYAGKANPNLLREILLGHDESFNVDRDSNIDGSERNWGGLKYLFFNREFPAEVNNFISVTTDEKSLLKVEHVFYYMDEEVRTNEGGEVIGSVRRRVLVNPSGLANLEDAAEITEAIRVTVESGRTAWIDLADDMRRPNLAISWRAMEDTLSPNCSYVSTEFLASETLAKLWDQITLSPNEDIVLSALRIIEKVERLAFVEDRNRYSPRDTGRLAIVKLEGADSRIPLNSMGDGMSRILQLILSVFPAKDGILLIDEFENGLHFSVQEEVWRIIFKLAKELNIQVFATTHSLDCIESFTKIAVEDKEAEGVLLRLGRSRLTSDNGKIIVAVYDETTLQTITASELEIR